MIRLAHKLIPVFCAMVLSAGVIAPPAAAASGAYMDTSISPSAAIQALIQQANQEQAQALASGNATVMQDTSTSDYYAQLVETNQDLKSHGVASIQLLSIAWGPIRIRGNNTARAVTEETWRTTYADGAVDESTDRNVYSLVRQNGGWKIEADVHPDSKIQIPAPGQGTAPMGQQASINWSGYQATGGSFTAVGGTWTLPQPSPTSFGADAAWVGIGGVSSRDLIQAGTEETVQNGQISYDAWIETLPQASRSISLPVHAGDSVSVSIAQSSPERWQVTLKNNTTGQSYRESIAYKSSLSSAEWVEEAPSARRGVVPLDGFGTINFSAGTTIKNGGQETIAQAGGQPITMINPAGQALATPSPLNADGSSFSVSRSGSQTGGAAGSVVTIPLPIGPGFPGVPIGPGLSLSHRGGRGQVRVP